MPCFLHTGVDSKKKQLLFIAGSTPDARRQIRVPLAALQNGQLSLRTDLMDAHLYIFDKQTFLKAVKARPQYTSIRQVAAHVILCCVSLAPASSSTLPIHPAL